MKLNQAKAQPRVLHVIADPATGVFLVGGIARKQVEQGYWVEFATGPGEYLEKLRQLGFTVYVAPISRRLIAFSHLSAVLSLWRIIRAGKYDVVHTHTPVAAFLGRLAAALARTPIIIYHMRTSWWDDASRIKRLSFTLVELISGWWTTHIFTINCVDAGEVIERGIVPQERVTCLHCGAGGVDIQRFNPAQISAEQIQTLRAELGLGSEDFVISFIGRLVAEKGILELLEAFQQVHKQTPTAKLLYIGGVLSSERDQQALQALKTRIYEAELGQYVILTGFRNDTPALIAASDVLVLPSHREGFGMVLAEAAAMARPVISSMTRGGREAIIPGMNGFLAPIHDADRMAEALLKLAKNPSLRLQMGQAGRRLAEERFSQESVFAVIDEVYSRLLKPQP